MLNQNKIIAYCVLVVIALISAYLIGFTFGKKVALKSFVKQYNDSEIRVGYGRYIGYKNISNNIEKQKYESAKCAADLNASSLYDELTACLSDTECSKLIDKESEYKFAPELFDKKPAGFKYYVIKGNIRSCDEAPH